MTYGDPTVTIRHKNHFTSWVEVSPQEIGVQMREHFSFNAPNYKFSPKYKSGMWSGKIYPYSPANQTIPLGLVSSVEEFCKANKYKFVNDTGGIVFPNHEVTTQDMVEFTKELKITDYNKADKVYFDITPYDYQIEYIRKSLENNRALLLSPTASGKSLIMYCLANAYMQTSSGDILIVVPTVGLVEQLYDDFDNYSHNYDGFDINDVYKIKAGVDKSVCKKITISTYQSLAKQDKEWFSRFGTILGDEAHSFKAKTLLEIMAKLENCENRIGLTGTLDGTKNHQLTTIGLFGNIVKEITTKELVEQGYATPLSVKAVVIKYNQSDCKEVSSQSKKDGEEKSRAMSFHEETDFINEHVRRNMFIGKIAASRKGNTLVLFSRIAHGEFLVKCIKKIVGDKRPVYFVDGSVKGVKREEYRKEIESQTNAIIVASFGTFSTGINIKNLHNIIFTATVKGQIRLLQSIGRGLRKHATKVMLNIYDVVDNISWKSRKNYSYKHFLTARLKVYDEEQFDYSIKEYDMP